MTWRKIDTVLGGFSGKIHLNFLILLLKKGQSEGNFVFSNRSGALRLILRNPVLSSISNYSKQSKFIYSEKSTKFCEIFPLLLTDTT
jgi:hypothetical protein